MLLINLIHIQKKESLLKNSVNRLAKIELGLKYSF